MAVSMNVLSPDSQVIALLCTTLALPRGELKPLSGAEWSALAATIHRSELRRPGELLHRNAAEIEGALNLPRGAADRLESLLRRGGQLAFELERLSSRGIWLLTRADDDYPHLLRERLGRTAPAVLYGAGRRELDQRAVAIVGSRDADPDSLDFAAALGRRIASDNIVVVSGGARGVDSTAMVAAVDAGGAAVGVVADALEKALRRQDLRSHVAEGTLTLLSAYHPEARFTVGNAMRRNRLIYCLGQFAVVVASGAKGGTREGAIENLKAGWVPLFVRQDAGAPAGNRELLRLGAAAISHDDLDEANLLGRLAVRAPAEQLAVPLEGPPAEPELGSPATVSQSAENVHGAETDLFALVWPQIADYLAMPRSEREVADHFGIELGQARSWLKRAVTEERAELRGRPRRYRLAAAASLFSDDERH
jgi:predicted Rossmann fold nucleotide-binding protein DprA/Smf involved in DNA uptake